ncbi:MAG: vorD [Geobacteraceae bacterium]|jgi:2-oxoglutarate ferredoxin oxidoreductase subunit delta|nr:vorD [Geobacteraceae bacterium]
MSTIEIDELRCKGCGLCTITCPKGLIELSDKINNLGYTPAKFDASKGKCTGCALCAEICPDVAIKVFNE